MKNENNFKEYERTSKELSKENKLLRSQIVFLENELRYIKYMILNLYIKIKIYLNRKFKNDGNFDNEKRNQEFQIYLEKIKRQHEKEIEEICKNNDLEKESLATTIFALQNELSKNENDNSGILRKENIKLNKIINEMKKNYSEEVFEFFNFEIKID